VALVGAGGIGHDVAAFLLHDASAQHSSDGASAQHSSDDASAQHSGDEHTDAKAAAADSSETDKFMSYWGIDASLQSPGGLLPRKVPPPRRQLYLLQRKRDKVGGGLGKTTGWIHRAMLKVRGLPLHPWRSCRSFCSTGQCR
jgi:2,4-dienoyl-CoA reductase (NADPH2)